MEKHQKPPMDPDTSEATKTQLDLAKAQGEAFGKALEYMVEEVAHTGGKQQAGEYMVGYAIEDAEGMYHYRDGQLSWQNPKNENLHVEIAVCDAADGRFIPNLNVTAALITPGGQKLGPYEQELVWHPMLYHYARNWNVPDNGEYSLLVHIEPPTFMRHDEVNGRRFTTPVDAEFTGVKVTRGSEPVNPPSD